MKLGSSTAPQKGPPHMMDRDEPTPGGLPLYVGGEWVTRELPWRDAVDLASAPRHLVYAAGLDDGYTLAYQQFRDVAELLTEHYGWAVSLARHERNR